MNPASYFVAGAATAVLVIALAHGMVRDAQAKPVCWQVPQQVTQTAQLMQTMKLPILKGAE